jgi:UDP-2,3-diacylglucosamine pyrophosphatase LpxH
VGGSGRSRVLVVGDIHSPWHSTRALQAAVRFAGDVRPTHIVWVGDQLDLYNWSRYSPSRELMTPGTELSRGMRTVRQFASELLSAAVRGVRAYVLASNHQDRILKRCLEQAPNMETLLDRRKLWIPDFQEVGELDLEGVHYMHGFRSKAVDHARYNQQSTVHGHTHGASLTWLKNRRGPYFNLEVGWLGNEKAPVFTYKQQKLTTWVTSLGLVVDRNPVLLTYRNGTFGPTTLGSSA